MDVSVIIATHNRCEPLAGVLEQLARQTLPRGLSWEVLVVDNNSTDATSRIGLRFKDQLPIRVTSEPTPGKSHALNRGLSECCGDLIVFTDDDVELPEGWIAACVDGAARYPDADILGGPVIPLFPPEASPFWRRAAEEVLEVGYAFTATFAALKEGLQTNDIGLFPGANFAIRRRVAHHRFCTRVGPMPRQHWILEEILFQTQILAEGGKQVFLEKAVIRHPVSRSRQNHRYLRHYHYWAARSAVRVSTEPCGMRIYNEFFRGYTDNWPDRKRLLGVPRVYWRVLACSLANWARGLTGNWRRGLKGEADAALVWGMMMEVRRTSVHP